MILISNSGFSFVQSFELSKFMFRIPLPLKSMTLFIILTLYYDVNDLLDLQKLIRYRMICSLKNQNS